MNLWIELPEGVVLAAELARPGEVEGALGSALLAAMDRPMVGTPRRPGRIRVATQAMAAEVERSPLRGVATVPVFVAPTPEADEVLRAMEGSVKPGAGGYVGGASSAGEVGRFFAAAAVLFAAAPWKVLDDSMLLRLDIEALGVEGACISILGHQLENRGFLVLPSIEAYENLPTDGGPSAKLRGLAVSFDRAEDVAPQMLREIETHGWAIAGEDAYPVAMNLVDGMHAPVGDGEIRVLTACCAALAGLFARFGADAVADAGEDEGEPICASFWDDAGVTARLTIPAAASDLFEVNDPKPGTGANPQVGRNDPCPCGSGKKYKRCHLGRESGLLRLVDSSPAPAVDPAAALHELDRRLMPRIVAWAKRALPSIRRPGKLPIPDIERLSELIGQWLLYIRAVEGETIATRFLAEQGHLLDEDERKWLAAQARSWLTIWEVEEIEEGRSLRIRDLLSGQVREVIERSASTTLSPRAAFLGRVVEHAGISVLGGIHSGALPPLEAAPVVALARRRLRRKTEVPIERLRDERVASYLITIWDEAFEDFSERAAILPKLQNTDGDPLLLTVDHYDFPPTDRGAVEAALRRAGAEMSPRRGSADAQFTFQRAEEGSKAQRSTIVAQVRVRDRSLRVETNSIRPEDEIRSRLEDACGELVQHRLREHTDPRSSALSGGDIVEREPPTPEMQRIVRQYKERHYATWPDEPLPALEGRTPRQAVQTKSGRERVEVLIKDLEHAESPRGSATTQATCVEISASAPGSRR